MDAVVGPLRAEAAAVNERRVLLLHGARGATYEACRDALDGIPGSQVTVLSERDLLSAEHLPPAQSGELLGRTREAVVVDAHDAFAPNALGRAVGAIDGGGLLVLLTPPLDDWPDRRDAFDDRLAVPPFSLAAVTGHFRRRLVDTLRAHRGIAIVDVDRRVTERDGLTDPAPRLPRSPPEPPTSHGFPRSAYDACLTPDQAEAVAALERLREPGTAVVVEADRGRGKSSAAGLAAGSLAAEGGDVVVTAPGYRNAAAVFDRAADLLSDLGVLAVRNEETHAVHGTGGGVVRFLSPPEAASDDVLAAADAIVVDEAAALPVRVLATVADGDAPVAYATTVHGYEGAGRGFSVRFRDHLAGTDRDVTEVAMHEPIRYAAADPVEIWAFRALALDATPAADQLVADATPDKSSYVTLEPASLIVDEHMLRETFGLLVAAHYRTEPDDLARLLDAPNVTLRALRHDGRVVAVALLAYEGGLSADTRRRMYEGGRVRGNMLPDVLTSQLRDPDAGVPRGLRVVRIATHHAVRSRGLGSRLLAAVREEFGHVASPASDDSPAASDADDGDGASIDYLSVGFGATRDLLRFWRGNGFRTVHLSTSRNDTSGEYSALLIDPLSDAGRALHRRTADWFVRRIPGVLADALDDCDPGVVAETLAATDAPVPLDLTDREWRVVAAAAFGPGIYDPAPRPFRRIALRALVDGAVPPDSDEAQLLVRKPLQAHDWDDVAAGLGFVSRRACMRALGDAFRPLVRRYGTEAAREEADRHG